MFADVYPLVRLPRRLHAFTYALPPAGDTQVCVGDLVEVLWRGRRVEAVVARLSGAAPSRAIKPIERLVGRFLNPEELRVYEEAAAWTFQSPSSVLLSARIFTEKPSALSLIKSDTHRFSRNELGLLTSALAASGNAGFIQTADVAESAILALLLHKKRRAPTLLLVPHAHDAGVAAGVLAGALPRVRIYDTSQKLSQRAKIASLWRSGDIPILVGTRASTLLPPPRVLGSIVVARSTVAEHAQTDRNPRYDARRIAAAWSAVRRCPIISSGSLPGIQDLFAYKTMTKHEGILSVLANAIVVPMAASSRKHPLLSDDLLSAVRETLQSRKTAWLVLNRKGVARAMTCRVCQFVEVCGTCKKRLAVYDTHLWCNTCVRATRRPETCRRCGGEVRLVAPGLSALAKELARHFPDTPITLVQKGGAQPSIRLGILLTTDFFFENFFTPALCSTGLVALVSFDEELARSPARVCEYAGAAYRLRARLLLQTYETSLTDLWRSDPTSSVERELEARRHLDVAPFREEVTLRLAKGAPGTLDAVVEKLHADMPALSLTPLSDGAVSLAPLSPEAVQALQKLPDSIILERIFL
ncbi:hypothetical protein HYW18_03195 [Candidatus Uhrbacteria bacterium]|nr:hypothetical protein [Candidatus Uhrbacteria bacterium]